MKISAILKYSLEKYAPIPVISNSSSVIDFTGCILENLEWYRVILLQEHAELSNTDTEISILKAKNISEILRDEKRIKHIP